MHDIVDEIALQHLRSVKIKEGFISAACPFHKDGQEKRPSFWINRYEGKWGCFSCGVGGPSLRGLLQNLKVRSARITQILEEAEKEAEKTASLRKAKKKQKARADFVGESILPEEFLGLYDYTPLGLIEEGFDEEVLKRHWIGYDTKLDRITYPIFDLYGNLVGVSGRQPDGRVPKYKVYQGWHEVTDPRTNKRERRPGELGEMFPRYSSDNMKDHLWRGHLFYEHLYNCVEEDAYVILTEGYKGCLWLVQMGLEYTAALMGSYISPKQLQIVSRLGVPIYVWMDNDWPGRKASRAISKQLAAVNPVVYECVYPDDEEYEGASPDDLRDPTLVEWVLQTAGRAGGRHEQRFQTEQTGNWR
jgi:DNA primase